MSLTVFNINIKPLTPKWNKTLYKKNCNLKKKCNFTRAVLNESIKSIHLVLF